MTDLPPVVKKFLRYVRYDTQSSEDSDTYPSTSKQKELSKLLVKELKELGLEDAVMDEHGYVLATLKSNVKNKVPVIGFIAHVDTSPEVSGKDVKPQIHPNYDGGAIKLNGEYTLTPEQCPVLANNKGNTIITSDGTTLLGADNKAGIAEIMTLVERLQADSAISHGALRIAFTCDEEVGNGTKYFDVKKFGADYAYTVDGEAPGEVENETFCADAAKVTITGVNVHPGFAKDKLVNAIKAAGMFVNLLPKHMTPETTEKRQGFLHPVSISGGVEKTTIRLILRDFEEEPLKEQANILAGIADKVQTAFPKVKVDITVEESYRNMRFVLDKHKHVVEYAMEAVRRAKLEPKLNLIRGGTDGARLSFMGLPTPNLFTGGYMFHSRHEWIAVEGMQAAVDTLVNLVRIWEEKSR
ncbi:MAG: peptidase T [Pseudomonadota bacterium]